MNTACKNGNLRIVKQLGRPRNPEAIMYASENGHLDIVEYLYESWGILGQTIDERSIVAAATNGHLNIVKFLIGVGVPIDEWAIRHAASNGHTNVVKFLRQYIDNSDAIDYAASNGHINVVKYLISIGDNVNIQTTEWLAKHGDLDILRYLLLNKAPYNPNNPIIIQEIEKHQNKLLKFLTSQNIDKDVYKKISNYYMFGKF